MLGTPKGWPKNKKKQVFFCCLVWFFCPFRLLMVTCRLHIPCCWLMCHSSLLSYFCCCVFFLCGGCVSLFLCIFIFIVLFTFHSVLCLCCILSLAMTRKNRSNHKISEILIFMFCFGACIPALPLGPDNNPTRAREEPLQMFIFALFVALNKVLKYLCLQCFFLNISHVSHTKWVPIKAIMVRKVQEKNRCFRNGLLRKMKTVMFTTTTHTQLK